jgi:hypothetical protein
MALNIGNQLAGSGIVVGSSELNQSVMSTKVATTDKIQYIVDRMNMNHIVAKRIFRDLVSSPFVLFHFKFF